MLRFDISTKSLNLAQIAIQTTQNNIANAQTPGYSRQEVILKTAASKYYPGIGHIGQGAELSQIQRKADSFLTNRIHTETQSIGRLEIEKKALDDIESLMTPSDGSILSEMEETLDTLSALGNSPDDIALRENFKDNMDTLGNAFQKLAKEFAKIQKEYEEYFKGIVEKANEMAQSIAKLNEQIRASINVSSDLLDKRDSMVEEISQLAGIRTSYSKEGSVQVVLGNRLLVDQNKASSLEAKQKEDGTYILKYQDSSDSISLKEGEISGILNIQNKTIPEYQNRLDTLAGQWIREINNTHATGIALVKGMENIQSEEAATKEDIPLNQAGFSMQSGKLSLIIRNKTTGEETSSEISIDPDAETLVDIAGKMSSVSHLSAQAQDGKLKLQSDSGYEFAFSQDSSYFLAEMKLNPLLSGKKAEEMKVSSWIQEDVTRISLAKSFASGNNENALHLMDTMQNKNQTALSGKTFQEYWNSSIVKIGSEVESKEREISLQSVILEDLVKRKQEVSGVSVDEELIRLQNYQYSYQAAARLFDTMDELMKTAITLGQ